MPYSERYFRPGEWAKYDLEQRIALEPERRKRDRMQDEVDRIQSEHDYEDRVNGRSVPHR